MKKSIQLKPFFFSAMVAFMATSFLPVKKSSNIPSIATPKIYAVIVGVSEYQNPNIDDLQFADKDALAVYNFLKSKNAGSIPEEQIVLLTNQNANRANILTEVETLTSIASENDVFIFYFAGHGRNIKEKIYYLSYDTDGNKPLTTAVSQSEIVSFLNSSSAKMKMMILDACHSGRIGDKTNSRGSDDPGLYADRLLDKIAKTSGGFVGIAAAQSSEKSIENIKYGGGHGLFTYFFLKGIYGEADKTDGDGIISINEAYEYARQQVVKESKGAQHVTLHDYSFNGEFPISVTSIGKKNITTEISKIKPMKKNEFTDLPKIKPTTTVAVPGTKQLSDKLCKDYTYSHGIYCFINETDDPLLIYYYRTKEQGINIGYGSYANVLIAPGKVGCTPRLQIGYNYSDGYKPASKDFLIYFQKEVNGTKYYARMEYLAEECTQTTIALSKDNMQFSTEKPQN